MVENRGCKSKLTKSENEVLYYISKEFLTIKQISIRRKTSDKAVYKIISNLKKKGYLGMVEKSQGSIQPIQPNQIRLHGEEFNINILFKDKRYNNLIEKSNILNIDGNIIRLYKNSLEIYSGQSFYADTPEKALYNSIHYWNRFLMRLEADLKVILVKSRYQNIKVVKVHFSEINNEIAKDYEVSGDKFRLYAKEDGKLAILIDNSFNLYELETLHPKTAKEDINKVLKQVNDWRENNPPTLSEVMNVINETTKINKETASGLNVAVKLMFPKEIKQSSLKEKRDISYFG